MRYKSNIFYGLLDLFVWHRKYSDGHHDELWVKNICLEIIGSLDLFKFNAFCIPEENEIA